MDKVRHAKSGCMAAIAMLVTAMLATGCASQGSHNETNDRREYCPDNMTMRCFKRTAEPEECTCVAPEKIEELIDDVIGN